MGIGIREEVFRRFAHLGSCSNACGMQGPHCSRIRTCNDTLLDRKQSVNLLDIQHLVDRCNRHDNAQLLWQCAEARTISTPRLMLQRLPLGNRVQVDTKHVQNPGGDYCLWNMHMTNPHRESAIKSDLQYFQYGTSPRSQSLPVIVWLDVVPGCLVQ